MTVLWRKVSWRNDSFYTKKYYFCIPKLNYIKEYIFLNYLAITHATTSSGKGPEKKFWNLQAWLGGPGQVLAET